MASQKNKVKTKISDSKNKPLKQILNKIEDSRYVDILFVVFAITIFMFTTFKVTGDDDFFWHLATGRYIVENKVVPDKDVFGFVTSGSEWIPFEWGWDVLTYGLYNIGGYNAILIFRSVSFIFIFLVLFVLSRKFKINSIITFIVLFTLLFSIMDRLTPRPHILTYIFFVLLLYIITSFKYLDREKHKKYLYFIPLIFLLWGNSHMGVLAGGLFLFIFTLSETLIYFYPHKFVTSAIKALDKKTFIVLIAVSVLSFVALFINPHGLNTYLYAYSHTKMKLLETINEWKNPFTNVLDFGFIIALYKVFLLFGLLMLFYSIKTKDIFFALVFIGFAIYSVRAVRFTVDYEIVTAFFIIYSINYFIENYSKKSSPKSILNTILYHNGVKVVISVLLIMLCTQIPSNSMYNWLKYYRVYGYGVNGDFLAVQLFDFMIKNDVKGTPLNHFGTGGYLVWHFPDQKNFIDSRNLNDEIFNEYQQLMYMQPGFEKKLEKYGIEYIIYLDPDLIRRTKDLQSVIITYATNFSKDWKLVFWDDKSFLFVKNLPKYQELISRYEYKILNPVNFLFKKNDFLLNAKSDSEQLKKELDRKKAEEPDGSIAKAMFQTFNYW